jgi:hypothetical protein
VEEKIFIQELYNEKTKNDSNSRTLANALDMFTKTVFEDSNRFIFELLQNADDSPLKKGVADIKVEIKLLNKYLIFSHTGKHFTKEDVKSISDLGSGDSGKTKDIEKTGYKGVGFKSIFNACDLVYILSNNFSFKFDKNHVAWKESQIYPWQIIPIWFEETELNSEVRKEINRSNVITIIPINNREKIENEILEVFSDSRIMLFLRHISEMSFFDGTTQKIRITREKGIDGLRYIFVNGLQKSSWLYKEFVIPVKKELKQKIQLQDKAIYPDKLKEATNIKISFAASVIDGVIHEISDALIYCYLPTKLQFNFNFLINGDFITNAERTRILDNDWNGFIFEQIAICKVKWLAELAVESKYKYQFTKLIRDKFSLVGSSVIKKSYNEGLDTAISKIPFIPMQDNNEDILKISDCIIDNTGFSEEFGTGLITSHFSDIYEVTDCRILNQNRLAALGAKKVDVKELCEIFLTEAFKEICYSDFQFNIRFIQFIYKKDANNQKFEWSMYLKSVAFLLNDAQQLNSPESLYFPLPEGEIDIADIIHIKCLNKQLFDNLKSNEELMMWITSLGVREPSEIDILRKSIYKMIESDLINLSNALQIGKFVFKVFNKGFLNENDYNKLSKLKLLTKKGSIELPKNCYLSDYYKPELKIESFFAEGNYVSPQYTKEVSEILRYKDMFLKMGVQEEINIKIEKSIERKLLVRKYPTVQSYLNFIDNGDFYDSQTKGYKFSGQHGLKNFVYIQYMEYSNNLKFSISLWKILLNDHWSKIYSNSLNSKYYTYLRETSLALYSYFQYYVKNNPSIPSDNGQCYKSTDLYSRNLKKIVEDFYPVVHKDISFDKEQEGFLGIKTIISIQDCLSLLKNLEGSQVDSFTLKKVDSIYKQIINNKPVIDKKLKFDSLKLLATDDSFQFVSSLYFFDVKGLMPPSNSKYFIKVSGSRNENEILFAYFDIPIIKNEALQLSATGAESNEKLRGKLIRKSKYLARLIASIRAEDPKEILYKLNKKIMSANFLKAESLSLLLVNRVGIEIYKQNIDSWYQADTDSVYFAGSLDSPLTLYNLSNSLSSLLEMKENDREIALILQLTDTDTEKWFKSIGYAVVDIEPDKCVMFNDEEDVNSTNYDDKYYEIEEDNFSEPMTEPGDDHNYPSTEFNDTQNMRGLNFYNGEKDAGLPNTSKKEDTEHGKIRHNSELSTSSLGFSDNFSLSSRKKRLISYVSSEASDGPIKRNKNEGQLKCQLLARNIVVDYEEKSGRRSIEPPETEEAYDFIVYNTIEEINRYIKIYGFFGEWNNYEVLLSTSQMKMAKEMADQFWLYIVEFVEDEQHARINRIQNPYNKITNYVLDYGWRAIAEKDNIIDKFVVGVKINHYIHGRGVIKGEMNKGKLKLLIVNFESGEKRIAINITQMIILED